MATARKSFLARTIELVSLKLGRKAVPLPPDPFGEPPVAIDPDPNRDRDLYMGVNTHL